MKAGEEKHRCPRCGLLIILVPERRESLHEAPVCSWFEQQIAETSGKLQGYREGFGDALELGPIREIGKS